MVNQPKRISIDSLNPSAVNGQVSARFGPGTGSILRRLTNYHNIWWSFICEPEVADANAHGVWVLWLKANTNSPDTIWSKATIDSDDNTMEVIACGAWAASNQTPSVFSSRMSSLRNLVANQELILTVTIHGITSGNVRIMPMLCASVSVK